MLILSKTINSLCAFIILFLFIYSPVECNVIFKCDFNDNLERDICNDRTVTGPLNIVDYDIFSEANTVITDVTSVYAPNKDNQTCTIPYEMNGVENFFCALNSTSFICKRNATDDFGECRIGQFLRSKRYSAYNASVYFNQPFQLINTGIHHIKFYSLIHCPDNACHQANDSLSIQYRYDSFSPFETIFESTRYQDKEWIHEMISHNFTETEFYLKINFIRENNFSTPAIIAFDELSIEEELITTTTAEPENPILFKFDFDLSKNCDTCKITNVNITDNQFVAHLNHSITDIKSIYSQTVSEEFCTIPFNYSNSEYNFCYLESNTWSCSVDENTTSECHLGNFLNAVSPSNSRPFDGSLDFSEPIEPILDRNYTFEFYTFINCQSDDCAIAGDHIALAIRKRGDLNYQVIFRRNSSERNLDNKWVKETFTYYLSSGISYYLKIFFGRTSNYTKQAIMAFDNLTISYEIDTSTTADTVQPSDATSRTTSKARTSEPVTTFISTAKTEQPATTTPTPENDHRLRDIIIIASCSLFIGLVALFLFFRLRNKNKKKKDAVTISRDVYFTVSYDNKNKRLN